MIEVSVLIFTTVWSILLKTVDNFTCHVDMESDNNIAHTNLNHVTNLDKQ